MPARLTAILLTLALLALPACKPKAPVELEGAASEPATAVRQLAQRLHQNDLVGFARDALPPDDFAMMETAWQQNRTRWPLSELPLADQLLPLLQSLSAPGAEKKLQASFNRQFAGQERDLRSAARSLRLFGTKYVQEQGDFSEDERLHYPQIIAALGDWAQQAPLTDRKRAQATIPAMCAAARAVGLTTDDALAAAGMTASLQKMGPFFAALKQSTARYGLDLDHSLADLRTGLVAQEGDTATVRIHYPLAEEEIDSVVHLKRIAGRWYVTGYLEEAAKTRATELPAEPPIEMPEDKAAANDAGPQGKQ